MPDDDSLRLDLVSRRNRELEAMIAVTGLSVRNAPLAEIEQEAVAQVEKLLSVDSVALCLATDDNKSLTLAAGTGMSEETRKRAGEIRFGLLWKVFQTGTSLVDNDLPSREGVRRDLMEGGVTVHSTIAAPLTAHGRVVGTLSACSYTPRTFLPEDATLLSTVGAQLAAVIENARLREELLSQKDFTEILLAAATAFGRATSLDELKEAMLEALQHATGEETVAILAFDEERDVGWIAAISNAPASALPMLQARAWGPGNAVFARLRETRSPVVLSAAEIQALDREAWESTRPAGMLFVPLFRQLSFFGAVSVNLTRGGAPDARMVSLVEGVAALGAASMSNLELWGLTERRAALSAALLKTAHELAGERNPEAILRITTRQARAQLQSDGALAVSDSPEGMRVDAADADQGVPPGHILGRTGLLEAVMRGGPLVIPDAESAAAVEREFAGVLRARSVLAAPMRAGGNQVGVILVTDTAPRIYSREEITALQTLATDAAVCLASAHLLDDLAQSNDEMRSAREQAVQSESLAAIGRLSASIAHEFRNPLAGISAAAQALLKVSDRDPGNVQLLQIIDRESQRLNRLITDFLQFARPRQPALRRVTVSALIDGLLPSLAQELADRVRIERVYAPDVPAANADGDLVRRVLMQLLVNAVQAMPDGGLIRIRVAAVPLRGLPAVEISIEDTGHGIPPADLGRIFEPFFSTKKTGTGLGLAICHQIISAHLGTIAVQNAPGGGARFVIVLPGVKSGSAPPATGP